MADEPAEPTPLEPQDPPDPPANEAVADVDEAVAETPEQAASRMRAIDSSPGAMKVARALRKMLPGDADYGDRLSTTGKQPSQVLGQRVAALTAERPSALREIGLSALQVWQALADSPGGTAGYADVAILFTDLVQFSRWALEAGDVAAVQLLRRVGEATEPPIEARGGKLVKRLGDGLMAVFDEPQGAVEAAIEATQVTRNIEAVGYRPQLRAGVHFGKAQKVGGDYLGVDVNVAARVAAAARANEVLVSETARERLDTDALRLKRKWLFRAKGAPEDLRVYAVRPIAAN
jgi:adenylate cyclase